MLNRVADPGVDDSDSNQKNRLLKKGYESVPEVAVDTDEDPPEVPLHED